MSYRKKNSTQLYKTEIPFDYYFYVSPEYRKYGEFTEDEKYHLLTTDEPLISVYLTPAEAKKIYLSKKYITGEADCSPEQRWVCDTFADTEFPTDVKPRVYYLDIETYSTDGVLPRFNHNVAEINAITIYDTYTSKFYCWFMVPTSNENDFNQYHDEIYKGFKEIHPTNDIDIKMFSNPKSLLGAFLSFMLRECPDIITAWNSTFDIPYIVRKVIDHYGLEGLKKLSPFGRVSFKVEEALSNGAELKIDTLIPGIDVIDMLELYKKNTPGQRPSYSLDAIAEEEVNEHKKKGADGDNDPNHMYLHNFVNFCVYNIHDVWLMTAIEKKKQILSLAIIIRNVTKANFQDVFYESILLDNLFIMEAVRRRNNGEHVVLPSRPLDAKKEKYLGAFVKEPLRGRWPWVADLDFTSLYPSIVKTFKLSSETIVGKVDNGQLLALYSIAKAYKIDNLDYVKSDLLPKYLSYEPSLEIAIDNYNNAKNKPSLKSLGTELTINAEYYPLYSDKNYPSKFNGMKEFTDWVKENNYALMTNGVIFDQNKEDAIVAKIIADVMNSRSKFKKLMKENMKNHNDEAAEVYNIMQLAFKVLNNSCYGVLGTERFRLFNVNISDSITTTGQTLIRSCTYITNLFLNRKSNTEGIDYVLTNDTDSVIFTLRGVVNYPTTTRDEKILEEMTGYSKECQNYINEEVYDICKKIFYKEKIGKSNNYLEIKNEWLADAGLFVAKKMYVVHKVFKEGIPVDKLDSTGISLRRSSTPAALKPFIKQVIEKILEFKNKEDVDGLVVEECRKLKDVYSISDIAIPSSLANIYSYANVPIHLRGIKIWNQYFAESEKDKLLMGKVKYFYVKRWENNKLNLDKEYVLSVPNVDSNWSVIEGKVEPDYARMKERLILKPMDAFYSALGWKLPDGATTTNNGILAAMKSRKTKIKYD